MGLLSYLKFLSFGKRDIAPKYMAMKMDIRLNVLVSANFSKCIVWIIKYSSSFGNK